MIRVESASSRPRWPGLAGFLALTSFAVAARAQDPPSPPDNPAARTQADDRPAPKADEVDPTTTPARDENQEKAALEDSVFVDARAQQAMANHFTELFRLSRNANTTLTIEKMARGEIRSDPATIDRHVKAAARELTDHGNIDAVVNPGDRVDNSKVKLLEAAGQALLAPLSRPIAQRDTAFQRDFTAKLLEVAPQLLSNHMIARTQAMLALSRLGDKAALDLLLKQLADPEQPVVLKALAAQGISTIATGQTLSVSDQARAAEALVALLRDPEEAFWPARVRALEALGNLRQISTIVGRDQALMAQAALLILSDPAQRPEVRAWAAWAIGMMDVPPSYPPVNYSLLAYQFARLAAAIGDEILIAPPERVKYLTGLLVFQVFGGIEGSPAVRYSGLLKARALGENASTVREIHELVEGLATDCLQLTRAAGTLAGPAKDAVKSRLAALKVYLAKNPPKNLALVPGAPPLQVAEPDSASAEPADSPATR